MQNNVWHFFPILSLIISEKCIVTPTFFWIPIPLAKMYFSCVVMNHAKMSLVKKPEFLIHGTYAQNVCAEASKVGTILNFCIGVLNCVLS